MNNFKPVFFLLLYNRLPFINKFNLKITSPCIVDFLYRVFDFWIHFSHENFFCAKSSFFCAHQVSRYDIQFLAFELGLRIFKQVFIAVLVVKPSGLFGVKGEEELERIEAID